MSVWHRAGDQMPESDWPVAYFITFTTYGTWVHGDERGSVDRNHNIPGTPYLAPNRRRVAWERRLSRQQPVTLDSAGRAVVKTAIEQVCRHRDWSLHALNVRTNHVHAVVSTPVRPEVVLHDFKAYATRALRPAECAGQGASPWTAGGSTRYLWRPAALRAACRYVTDDQGLDLGSEPPQ